MFCRVSRPDGGFTLVELLIAMTLTAIIGTVLFSTYRMVMDNGRAVRNRVIERESERVFRGIIDNDMAGMCVSEDRRSTLPLPSRRAITPSAEFYRATGADRPGPSNDRLIFSFATTTTLAEHSEAPIPGPVCVEYVLRSGHRGDAFVRRERDFCGIDGEFPWSEMVLVHDVSSLSVELFSAKTQFVSAWDFSTGELPEAVRFSLRRGNEDQPERFLVPIFPRRIHAAR